MDFTNNKMEPLEPPVIEQPLTEVFVTEPIIGPF
jgi:hypothetical protein